MGFLGQAYKGMPECNVPSLHAKRRKIGDKFAFLKRAKARLQSPANIRHNNIDSLIEEEKEQDDFLVDGIPRSISTFDDLTLLSLSSPSFDSLCSPCQMMRKNLALQRGAVDDKKEEEGKMPTIMQHQNSLFGKNQEEAGDDGMIRVVSPCESIENELIPQSSDSVKYDEAIEAKLQNIMQQTPSLDHLSQYVAALSEAISPDPSAALPSRALRCLFFLSEYSSHKQQRFAMVQDADTSLVPTLLAYLERCLRKSSQQHLALLILNNLSIPTGNKRLIAQEYSGIKILGKLLIEDPECQMLVIIMLNLAFGDEKCPLIDPEDPVTCRMVARVVNFLDIWKERGLPFDFRPLYGVNTGLCTI
mmetsp:Transcript_3926/g.6447  ORF Transcript_3926/g.6447 Transcript_3926/m.6447 type:complete len:361 (-) Transcript_3926:153-1235(-)